MLRLRGGGFVFACGQDHGIGYEAHCVQMHFVESFSFRVATPGPAVPLPWAG